MTILLVFQLKNLGRKTIGSNYCTYRITVYPRNFYPNAAFHVTRKVRFRFGGTGQFLF